MFQNIELNAAHHLRFLVETLWSPREVWVSMTAIIFCLCILWKACITWHFWATNRKLTFSWKITPLGAIPPLKDEDNSSKSPPGWLSWIRQDFKTHCGVVIKRVIFSPNPHNIHPIACLWGQDNRSLLWAQTLIYVLPQSLQCYMQYHVILNHFIMDPTANPSWTYSNLSTCWHWNASAFDLFQSIFPAIVPEEK